MSTEEILAMAGTRFDLDDDQLELRSVVRPDRRLDEPPPPLAAG
jgi:hypothetical protein